MKYHDIFANKIISNYGNITIKTVEMTLKVYYYYFDYDKYLGQCYTQKKDNQDSLVTYTLCDCYRYYYKQSTKKTCCDDCKKIKKDKQ